MYPYPNHTYAQYLIKHRFVPSIADFPVQAPQIIVTIPSFKEPALLNSLQSLYRCRMPSRFVEVIVAVNHPEHANEDSKRQNQQNLCEVQKFAKQYNNNNIWFHAVYKPDIPEKISGVGYARKIAMDEAVYRFYTTGVADGVIVGFDADSACDENYFEEIERCFFSGRTVNGASIYFEHPIEGNDYDTCVYEGVTSYELHLRYLNQALRYAGFPYAFHTVGSSFAVSASAYVRQGGMNKRKAGEDFHFLQKIIPLGDYAEINATRVIPSPRPSDRVPFGTGASIRQWLNGNREVLQTYPLEPFEDLRKWFALVPYLFKANPNDITKLFASLAAPLQDYLLQNHYLEHIAQANANSASHETFAKRFFAWFDGLKTVKYLNDSFRNVYAKHSPEMAAGRLLQKLGYEYDLQARELLQKYREIERENSSPRI